MTTSTQPSAENLAAEIAGRLHPDNYPMAIAESERLMGNLYNQQVDQRRLANLPIVKFKLTIWQRFKLWLFRILP